MAYNYIGRESIALYPNRKGVIAILRKIKLIFKNSQNATAADIINKLNPIIGG